MRAQLVLILALVPSLADMYAQDATESAKAYAVQAADVARQVLLSEYVKHPERVQHVSITFSFRIDAEGRPRDVKIVSKTPNPWAADVARRTLSTAQFPPIPKKIFDAFGTDGANIQADFDTDGMEERKSATFAYSNQIGTIVLQAVAPELAKHQERLDGGTVEYSFRLDHEGRLQNLKIVSSTFNNFVENTCLQMIRVAKFPPIPKEVIAEQGHDWVDVHSEVAIRQP
jgi:TonB family protein